MGRASNRTAARARGRPHVGRRRTARHSHLRRGVRSLHRRGRRGNAVLSAAWRCA
jgi:hypothetical protein